MTDKQFQKREIITEEIKKIIDTFIETKISSCMSRGIQDKENIIDSINKSMELIGYTKLTNKENISVFKFYVQCQIGKIDFEWLSSISSEEFFRLQTEKFRKEREREEKERQLELRRKRKTEQVNDFLNIFYKDKEISEVVIIHKRKDS